MGRPLDEPSSSPAQGGATPTPTRSSCAHTRASRCEPPTCSPGTPPTPRRRRRTRSSRRTARSGASGPARPSSRGCCGSSRTRPGTAAARPAGGRGSRCAPRRDALRGGGPLPGGGAPRRRAARGAVAALNRLPDPDREAIACRYFLDLSEAETAAALGSARARSSRGSPRALERLRRELGRGGGDDRARAPGARRLHRSSRRSATSRPRSARACAAARPAAAWLVVVLAAALRRGRGRVRGTAGALGDPSLLPSPGRDDRVRRQAAARCSPPTTLDLGIRSIPPTPSERPGSGRSRRACSGAPTRSRGTAACSGTATARSGCSSRRASATSAAIS